MLIIQGSHRKTGNTNGVAEVIQDHLDASILHLSDFKVAHFTYEGGVEDDFEQIIARMIEHQEVVWATPIYWYTMSGMMKVLLDRISDLLKWNKDLGRKLRGLKMHVVSVSGSDDAPEQFVYPFKMSAEYLGMTFGSYVHAWGENGALSEESKNRVSWLCQQIAAEMN